jgi:hypothetical protein
MREEARTTLRCASQQTCKSESYTPRQTVYEFSSTYRSAQGNPKANRFKYP